MWSKYQSYKRLKKETNFIYLISAKCITDFLLILQRNERNLCYPHWGAKWASSQKFITSRHPACFPDTPLGFNSITTVLTGEPWAWPQSLGVWENKGEAAALGWGESGTGLEVEMDTTVCGSGIWLQWNLGIMEFGVLDSSPVFPLCQVSDQLFTFLGFSFCICKILIPSGFITFWTWGEYN